ncbi:hypothetical protein B0H14DRAFT_3167061 [Mycena olivaceomarginata]|nr:hypothetical protein B0H14DRAFT_3167061 [Mycena olivaceomarginata]
MADLRDPSASGRGLSGANIEAAQGLTQRAKPSSTSSGDLLGPFPADLRLPSTSSWEPLQLDPMMQHVHSGTFFTAANVNFFGTKERRLEETNGFLSAQPVGKRQRLEKCYGIKIFGNKNIKLIHEIRSGPGYFLHTGQNKGRAVIFKIFNPGPTAQQCMMRDGRMWKFRLRRLFKTDLPKSKALGYQMVAGLSNFHTFLDFGDRFVISINPPQLEEGDNTKSQELEAAWNVFNALCQKVDTIQWKKSTPLLWRTIPLVHWKFDPFATKWLASTRCFGASADLAHDKEPLRDHTMVILWYLMKPCKKIPPFQRKITLVVLTAGDSARSVAPKTFVIQFWQLYKLPVAPGTSVVTQLLAKGSVLQITLDPGPGLPHANGTSSSASLYRGIAEIYRGLLAFWIKPFGLLESPYVNYREPEHVCVLGTEGESAGRIERPIGRPIRPLE